jgi:rhamnosyl/mannosyltransferase
MRVLHIGKYFPPFFGGIENFMADLMVAQVTQGIEVTALVHNHHHAIKVESAKVCVENDAIEIHRVPAHGKLLYAPFSPLFPLVLWRLINKFKPDVLHLHVPNTSVFWVLLLASAKRIPWVIHWHADVVSDNQPMLQLAYYCYRPLETRLLAECKAIIVTSRAYLDASKPLSFWRHKCHIIPLGLAPRENFLVPLNAEDKVAIYWGEAKFKILCLGRLSYYKGHDILIEAIKQLDNTKLIIVGQGEKYTQLRSQINSNNLQDTVLLMGGQPAFVVLQLLASCDCVCLASTARSEAFGMVLLEAMAQAKAVVATNILGSGVGWVVKRGVTGRLVQPGNSDALAEALKALINNPELCVKMGQAGESRFNRKFHIKAIAAQIRTLYQQLFKDTYS